MKALILEEKLRLSLRDIDLPEKLGPRDLRIAVHTVGICGSDLHYYLHGAIGPFVVRSPMVLGHEASGVVLEAGSEAAGFEPGDRVCMEPGIPDPDSRASRLGLYNLDPAVRFWATPPVHGCLRESVVHPAAFTFKLPESVSHAEGAMVEPLAVGMHAAAKAAIKPGDLAVVLGCGTIGIMTALAALAGGASRVIIADIKKDKLDFARRYDGLIPVDLAAGDLRKVTAAESGGWGADIVFEAAGAPDSGSLVFELLAPGGRLVLIGLPQGKFAFDVSAAQVKEARVETVFRYAHVYPRALALMGSGRIDLKPLVTASRPFKDAVRAFETAARQRPGMLKDQLVVAE